MEDSDSEFQAFQQRKQRVQIQEKVEKEPTLQDFKYLASIPFKGSYPQFSSERLKDKIPVLQVVLLSSKEPKRFSEFIHDAKNEVNAQMKKESDHLKKIVFLSVFKIFFKHILCFLSYLQQKMSLKKLVNYLGNPKTDLMISFVSKQDRSTVQIYFNMGNPSTSDQQSNISSKGFRSLRHGDCFEDRQDNILKQYIDKFLESRGILVFPSKKKGFYLIIKSKELGTQLGSGGYGVVYRSQYIVYRQGRYVQETWAIKELKKKIREGHILGSNRIGCDRQWHMVTTMSILQNFKSNKWSNNIIKIDQHFENLSRRYIVYEYCPYQDLTKFHKPIKSPYFQKTTKKHIFLLAYNIIATLKFIHYDLLNEEIYLHQFHKNIKEDGQINKDKEILNQRKNILQTKGIIHRDLKLGNIAIKNFGEHWINLKIIDWAFSKPTLTDIPTSNLHCGTDTYLAPQFDDRSKTYSCKVDVWAFGVTLYSLLTGTSLIKKGDPKLMTVEKQKVESKIKEMNFLQTKNFTKNEKEFYCQVLRRTLQIDPQKRTSSKELQVFFSHHNVYRSLNSSDKLFLFELKTLRVKWMELYASPNKKTSQPLVRSALNQVNQRVNKILLNLYQKHMEFVYGETEDDCQILKEMQREIESLKDNKNDNDKDNYLDLQSLSKDYAKKEFQKVIKLLSKFNKYFDEELSKSIIDVIQAMTEKWEENWVQSI